MEPSNEALWQRVMSDYKCQLSAIESMRLALGGSFNDPRDHKGNQGDGGKFVSLKKETQADVPKNMWTIPFLLYTYDVKRSNFQNKTKNDKLGVSKLTEGLKKRVQWNKGYCVITDRVASRRKYNATKTEPFGSTSISLNGLWALNNQTDTPLPKAQQQLTVPSYSLTPGNGIRIPYTGANAKKRQPHPLGSGIQADHH
jgi:hypothetical protein